MSRHEIFPQGEPDQLIPCDKPCAAQNRCMMVTNQGKLYRCAHALAQAHGVTPGAVWQAFHRTGSTDCLGRTSNRGNYRKPLKIGPFSWPSYTTAARDLGVDRSLIGKLLKNDPQRLLAMVMKKKSV